MHTSLYTTVLTIIVRKEKYLWDFQKAFDSVPRNKLFQKLLDYNINGKFYDCLTNLYTGDKSCVKLGDRVTITFELTQSETRVHPKSYFIQYISLRSTTRIGTEIL